MSYMLSCILLTAGQSQRYGSPKALAEIDGKTLIELHQQRLINTHILEVIVVTGSHATEITPFLFNHKHINVVYNKDHNFGQTSSFKAGLKLVSVESEGAFLLPVDYPFIKESSFVSIQEQFVKLQSPIIIPTFQGVKGHPPLFSRHLFEEILSLDNTQGLNSIAKKHKEDTFLLEVDDPGVTQTFNTVEEFENLCGKKKKNIE